MNKTRHHLNQSHLFKIRLLFLIVWLFAPLSQVISANQTIELRPGDNFEDAVESLQPGDILIVHAGTYSGTGRISIAAQGTADQPIVIKSASGEPRPHITRPQNNTVQNTINIEGSSYLTIQGLEISGNGGDGIKVSEQPSHHVVLQDLVIHDIDVGINTKNNSNHFTIRDNHIYNTGIDQGTGEGMYIGCHDGSCSLSDSIIEHNLIHDALPGTTQGDGIEIKFNSQNIIIRDNVIYNRPFPGIFVYGGGGTNIVEGNVVWNSLEGIAAVSDTIVRNNILFDNETGIISFHHSAVPFVANTSFINNTLYNNDIGALIRWEDASNMVFANNAVYSPGKVAIDSNSGSNSVSSNVTEGLVSNVSTNTNISAFIEGRTAELDFVNAPNRNFWPTADSALIASADSGFLAENDFNAETRQLPSDIGAYQRAGQPTNPGWALEPDFKGIVSQVSPPPVVNDPTPSLTPAFIFSTTTTITHDWKTIEFPSENRVSDVTPVVIASVPTINGPQPGVVQISNILLNQVDIHFKEYAYLDGLHIPEQVSLLVAEPGVYHLENGTIIEVGSFDLSTSPVWQSVNLSAGFPAQPKLFLTIQSADYDVAAVARARNVQTDSFQAALYQQESSRNQFLAERIGYIAIYHPQASGVFSIGSGSATVSLNYLFSEISVNHRETQIANAAIRLEEEQSRDLERFHVNETVNLLLIDNAVFGQIISNNGADTASLRIR